INQVFLNLLINAAHAIADARRDDGRIAVRTHCDGDAVVISIADNGCGIPAAIRGRVFDLFFTTKPVGQGTGQWLASARWLIVEKHGGEVWFETREGEGTTCFIRLPASAATLATIETEVEAA